jgi:hypothetical protein
VGPARHRRDLLLRTGAGGGFKLGAELASLPGERHAYLRLA